MRSDEQGMALLAVLIVTALVAALCVTLLDDVRFALRRSANAQSVSQARWYALGAEALARTELGRLSGLAPERSLSPLWRGRTLRFALDEGVMEARISDATSCFNINSLVEGQGEILVAQPLGRAQFEALMRALGESEASAAAVAAAASDFIDSDQIREPGGAEDEAYGRRAPAYRTSGALMSEPSELRAVAGMNEALYQRLRPYLCAMPEARLSPINVNALTPSNAVLITMLTLGQVQPQAARAVIAARPAGGWRDIAGFWSQPQLRLSVPPDAAASQIRLRTEYYRLETRVELDGADVVSSALFQTHGGSPPRLVARRWTLED